MSAKAADVTLTFPCDRRFVDALRAAVWAAVTCVGQSEARGLATADAVAAFIQPDLAAPQASLVVVEITSHRARMSTGSRHLTVDL